MRSSCWVAIVSLAPLYDWALRRGYAVEREHIVIARELLRS